MALQKKDRTYNTIGEMPIYLNEMKLSTMANTLMEQLNDPNIGLKNADERIVDMVSKEYLLRYANKIARELKKANLKYPNADFADLITSDDRTLDKNILDELMTCDFIEEKRNLVITGPCGSGKTWIACMIAVKALTQLKTVRFCSSSKLVLKLSGMTSEAYLKALDQMAKLDLLILDDVGMMDLDLKSCRIFFEVLDSMEQNGSIIFISQYPVKNWYTLFEKATFADASLSRATGKARRLEIKGKDFRKL